MDQPDMPPADRSSESAGDSGPIIVGIVGIGASAGGIEAFRSFFTAMPVDSGMAFVVVLHLPADRPSLLPDILARWTARPEGTVHDGAPVEANTVYVPPLREHMDGLRGPPRVQIFATDIDEPAIDTARLGRYPTMLLDGLSPERRERFFRRSDHGYVVANEIRDLCTFSPHSLVRDPPCTITATLVTFLDVTGIVLAERHQRLLVDELNHRLKNMLTVVISLAAQTMRHSARLEDFSAAFMGRVRALSASYALLSSQNWISITLRETIEQALRPFALSSEHALKVDGEDVQLTPAAALALGMAINELATNAVEYGALSTPGGVIDVVWRIAPWDGIRSLIVEWTESGGPAVAGPPTGGLAPH